MRGDGMKGGWEKAEEREERRGMRDRGGMRRGYGTHTVVDRK